jgi:hypothetical protein
MRIILHKFWLALLLCASCWLICAPAVMAHALPQSEIQALSDFPNWVGDTCASSDTGDTPALDGTSTTSDTPDTSSSCACTAGVGVDASINLTGNNEQDVWNYFKSKGLSDAQAAGVLGNLDDESHFDPELSQLNEQDTQTQPKVGGGDGWGLAQWTYPSQDVGQLFGQYKIKGNQYDLIPQLDLIWAQMNHTSPTGVNNMYGTLKTLNDPGQIASFFDGNFEGGDPSVRVSDAETIYSERAKLDSGSSGSTNVTTAAAQTSTTTSDILDNHKLPATVGGTGDESTFQSYALGAPKNAAENNYYITMRWRYSNWNWDGTSVPGSEDVAFYETHPKVLVTNPRNHKSIIADALESGPAPWTGVDTEPNNIPKEGWTNPQDGTPPGYTGRVSGFPPTAIQALGAIQKESTGAGDNLEYAWAPDQSAPLGPTNLQVNNTGSTSTDATTASCDTTATVAGDGSNNAIVQVAEQELKLGLQGTGEDQDGGPVCKYEGSGCPQAWCADFVSWVYKTAGKPFTGGADGGWRIALASDATGYFLDRKGQPDIGYGTNAGGDPMEPGWVVSFAGIDPGVRGIGHVGIVTQVNSDGTFNDIEGNGEGAGVSQRSNIPTSSAIDWGGYK